MAFFGLFGDEEETPTTPAPQSLGGGGGADFLQYLMPVLGALQRTGSRRDMYGRPIRQRWAGGGLGGGGGVNQAAMLRAQQEQAEVEDLQRVTEIYGQALDWAGNDPDAALTQVQNLKGTQPFKTVTGARAFLGMIPKMQQEAAKFRAAQSERAGITGAYGQQQPMETPDDFVRRLIANGVDPETALKLGDTYGKNFRIVSPAPGMEERHEVLGRGTPGVWGRNIRQGTGGAPDTVTEYDEYGRPVQRVLPGSVGPRPEKDIVQWSGQEGQAAPPGFGGIQHTPQQPPIMDPGLEIAAPDQPINLRRPGMPEPMGDRPIDPSRPVLPGLPGPLGLGGRSIEETFGFNLENGQTVLLPTIVQGQRVTPQQAVALYRMGRNEPVGAYGGPQEAETAAQARSQRIGQMLGPEGVPGAGPRTLYTPPVPTPLPGMEPESQTLGGVTYKRADRTGTEKLSQPVLDLLATEPPAGPPGSPERQAQIQRKVDQIARQRTEVSEAQGARGVGARLAEERKAPLAQKGLGEGRVVWDLESRAPVDELNYSMEDVRGKPHRFRSVDRKTAEALIAIGEVQDLLTQYDPLVETLAKDPLANWGRALEMWSQTFAGQANPGVAFEAMRGTVLRVARAMQGSAVQLSDQDRDAVVGMIPKETDGLTSGRQRLEVVRRILSSMYDANVGNRKGLAATNAILRANGGEGAVGQLPASKPAAGGAPTTPAAPKRQEYRRDKNGNLVPVP